MADLKPGTLCVIVAGCPKNIGMVIEVVTHLGNCYGREDAYEIKTLTGRNFRQMWVGNHLKPGESAHAITDGFKLRPLVEDGAPESTEEEVLNIPECENAIQQSSLNAEIRSGAKL